MGDRGDDIAERVTERVVGRVSSEGDILIWVTGRVKVWVTGRVNVWVTLHRCMGRDVRRLEMVSVLNW